MASTFFTEDPDFQLLAYGELVVPGTASSLEDIYHYNNRNIKVGNIYVFALGLVLKNEIKIPLIFKHGFLNIENVAQPCFIVPMNDYLSVLFKKFNILHMAPKMTNCLSNILYHPVLNHDLHQRKREGFILSGDEGQGYIKWVYYKTGSPDLCKQAHYLVQNQWTYEAKGMAEKIQSLYKEAQRFINVSKDSYLNKAIENYMNTKNKEMVEKFQSMYKYGPEYQEIIICQLIRDAYNWLKQYDVYQFDPKVKIHLKNRLGHEIRMYLKSFDFK